MSKQSADEPSIFDFVSQESPDGRILREGLQALYRERMLAFNVATSIAVANNSKALPKRDDFELPLIIQTIRRSGWDIMPQPM